MLLRFLHRILSTPQPDLPSLLPPAACGSAGQQLLLGVLQRVREQLLLLPCAAADQAHVLDEAHLHRVAALYALQVSLVNVAAVCLCKKSFEFALLRVCPCNNWHRIIPPPILARFHFLLLLSRLPPPLTSSSHHLLSPPPLTAAS